MDGLECPECSHENSGHSFGDEFDCEGCGIPLFVEHDYIGKDYNLHVWCVVDTESMKTHPRYAQKSED